METNNEEEFITEETVANESGFKPLLFAKIVGILIAIYAIGMYFWTHYIQFWWYSTSEGFKRLVFWVILLDIAWGLYKKFRNEEK